MIHIRLHFIVAVTSPRRPVGLGVVAGRAHNRAAAIVSTADGL
jgi:hypothetical protein